jgi:anaerobic selenocysteine-containing dehydrogenase
VSDRVQPGVAAASKGYWPKRVPGRANANATVAERDSDMGGGAVFHDNRVEVAAVSAPVTGAGDGSAWRAMTSTSPAP